MSKSSFKKLLRNPEKKGAPAEKPWEVTSISNGALPSPTTSCPSPDAVSDRTPESAGAPASAGGPGESGLSIYTDRSVCRVLRIRRRILADARTAASRGRDWDASGEEVGMTKKWIEDYALEHGIVPDFFGEGGLEKVSGRYVSCKLIGTTPNHSIVQVELEANGSREFCRTRNIIQYPIHYKEIFSAVRIELPADRHLEWIAQPNEVKY